MEMILREDVAEVGRRGEVVKVSPGYARNFLLPKRLAVAATPANKKIVEQERQAGLQVERTGTGHSGRTTMESLLRAEATRVFGDKDVAEEWLHAPIPSLGGRKPLEMVKSSRQQRDRVYQILGRIEHGIF